MFCKNCGTKLEPNAAFCPNCGTKMDQVVAASPVTPEVVQNPTPVTQTPAPVMPDAPVAASTPQVVEATPAAPVQPAAPVVNQAIPNPGVQPAMPQGAPSAPAPAPQKSGMSPVIIIIIVVLAVCVVVLGFILIKSKAKSSLNGNNGSDNPTVNVDKTTTTKGTTTTKMTTKRTTTTTKGIVSTSDSVTLSGIKFNVPSGYEYEKEADKVLFVNELKETAFIFSALPNGECNETNFPKLVENYKEQGVNVVSTEISEYKGRKYYLMAAEIDNVNLVFGYTNIKNIGVAVVALEYSDDEDIIDATFDAVNYVVDSAKSSSVFSPNENETIDITKFDFSKLKN